MLLSEPSCQLGLMALSSLNCNWGAKDGSVSMGLSNNLHLTFIGRPWGSMERKSWSRICIDPCHLPSVRKNMASCAEKVDFRAPSLFVAEPQIAARAAGEATMTHQMQQKAWQKKTIKNWVSDRGCAHGPSVRYSQPWTNGIGVPSNDSLLKDGLWR